MLLLGNAAGIDFRSSPALLPIIDNRYMSIGEFVLVTDIGLPGLPSGLGYLAGFGYGAVWR